MIHIIPHLDNDENEIKGSNKINGEDVSNYYLFPKGNSNGYDITFVIGCNENIKNTDKIGILLLCRFHNFQPLMSRKKKQTAQKLFNDIIQCLKNNGLERKRSGGSSGYVTYSENLMQLLKTHNCTPRISKGMIYS